MSIGVISLSTNAKKDPSGAPFTSGSAHNGTSIDTAGKVVLGNDVGDPAAPAALESNREILMYDAALSQFQIILNAIQTVGVQTLLQGGIIQIDPQDASTGQLLVGGSHLGTTADILALTNDFGTSTITARNTVDGNATVQAVIDQTGLGNIAALGVRSGNIDRLEVQASGNGVISFRAGQFLLQTMAINTATLCTRIQSDTSSPFNGATLQVSGTHTYRKFPQSQNGVLTLDRDQDSAKVLRNSGALTINFPNFVGANFRDGFFVDVLVTDAAGITINAGAGRKIFFGDLATSVNGTLSATNVGSCVRIYVVDSTNFYATFFIGAWSLT